MIAQPKTFLFRWVMITVLAAASVGRLDAVSMDSYDLDSLVFMSEHIVQGYLTHNDPAGTTTVNRLIVRRLLMGSLKSGDWVSIASLDRYRKPGQDKFGPPVQIGDGDEVMAFLIRAKPDSINASSVVGTIYEPVPSGLRLVTDGKVYNFHQLRERGPYYLMRADGYAPGSLLEILATEDFEKRCAESIARVQPIVGRLSGFVTKDDAPWLLQVLRSRAASIRPYVGDAIAEAVCAKLAETKDLATLDQALQLSGAAYPADKLYLGFASAEGREYLFSKLRAPELVARPSLRQVYARALGSCFAYSAFRSIPNKDSLERLARLAVDFGRQGDDETARILLGHLRTAVSLHEQNASRPQNLPPNLEPDVVTALRVLKDAYEQIRSPRLQYAMDRVFLQASPGLGFECASPVATYLSVPGPEDGYRTREGYLAYAFSFDTSPSAHDRVFDGEFTLEDMISTRVFVLKRPPGIQRLGLQGISCGQAALPPDMPPGRYRFFCRVTEKGIPVGDGHGVEVDLPVATASGNSRPTNGVDAVSEP